MAPDDRQQASDFPPEVLELFDGYSSSAPRSMRLAVPFQVRTRGPAQQCIRVAGENLLDPAYVATKRNRAELIRRVPQFQPSSSGIVT